MGIGRRIVCIFIKKKPVSFLRKRVGYVFIGIICIPAILYVSCLRICLSIGITIIEL